mmetsp:Transcript_22262/g.31105  ORF Transcript_22262/g.31105 Transcript_22262/m.31105 type:complete len:246 (+) Transcript_22262:177-914(+)
MSFFSGIKDRLSNVGQKVRSALIAGSPRTVDDEYDMHIRRMKGFDKYLRDISKRTATLVQSVDMFAEAAEHLIQDLEVLSEFDTKTQKEKNHPWNKEMLDSTRACYEKLNFLMVGPKEKFQRDAGISIEVTQRQILDCKQTSKVREAARERFDASRSKVRKWKIANEQKLSRGQSLTFDEIRRQREAESDEAKFSMEYETINIEVAYMSLVIESLFAMKEFCGIRYMQLQEKSCLCVRGVGVSSA